MPIQQSAGNRLYVSASQPATYTVGAFEILAFTEVGEVVSIGEFGGSDQIANHVSLATGTVVKRKGSVDYGSMPIQIGKTSDAGQSLLKAGFDGAARYTVHSFKIINESGEVVYFTGLVGSTTNVYSDANAVTGINCNIELDGEVLFDGNEAGGLSLLETTTGITLVETTTGIALTEV